MKRSKAEIKFAEYWEQYQELFPLVEEQTFHATRRWRTDFSNLEWKLAIEIQGFGGATGGHGGSRQSLKNDTDKIQQLAILGWTYFPIVAADVTSRVDVAVEPLFEWINLHTDVKIKKGW
jgi:hypothetical protein